MAGGHPLSALWGLAANDIWAVGAAGTILHWDGTRASIVPLVGTVDLHGVWGSAANDVYFVGDSGTVAHWDGTQVSFPQMNPRPQADLMSIWGISATDLCAVGLSGTEVCLYGTQWTVVTNSFIFNGYPANLSSNWFSSEAGCIVGTDVSGEERFPSLLWGPVEGWSQPASSMIGTLGVNGTPYVWGTSEIGYFTNSPRNNSGLGGWEYFRYTLMPTAAPVGVAFVGDELWVADGSGTNVDRWSGSAWTTLPTGSAQRLTGIWAIGTQAWVINQGGGLLYWNGTNWTPLFGG